MTEKKKNYTSFSIEQTSEDIFTRLIWLTLFTTCYVTYTSHQFPNETMIRIYRSSLKNINVLSMFWNKER